jgi:hypothetical protein
MARTTRVPIPVSDELRQIAKIERRSIAKQGQVAIEQFVEHWRRVPVSDKITGNREDKS